MAAVWRIQADPRRGYDDRHRVPAVSLWSVWQATVRKNRPGRPGATVHSAGQTAGGDAGSSDPRVAVDHPRSGRRRRGHVARHSGGARPRKADSRDTLVRDARELSEPGGDREDEEDGSPG